MTEMTNNSALELAVEALEEVAENTYEGEELEEPDCVEFVEKRWEAARTLRRLLGEIV